MLREAERVACKMGLSTNGPLVCGVPIRGGAGGTAGSFRNLSGGWVKWPMPVGCGGWLPSVRYASGGRIVASSQAIWLQGLAALLGFRFIRGSELLGRVPRR